MAKKVIQMYDKYKSTTKIYPKIIGECLTQDALDAIKSEVASNYEITQVVVDDGKVLGSQVKDVENDVTYNLPLGSQVEANPTLAGTESALEGLEIDGTKYKVGGGSQLYRHNIIITDTDLRLTLNIINDSNTPFTIATLATYMETNGFTSGINLYEASGWAINEGNLYILVGINKQAAFYATGVDTSLKTAVNLGIGSRTINDIIVAL